MGLRSDWTATPCDRRWRLNTKPVDGYPIRVDDDGDVAWLERLDLLLLPGAVLWTFSCRLAPWPRRQASGASRLRFLAPISATKPPRPVVSPVPSAGLGRSLQSTADLRDDAGCRHSAAHRPGGLGFGTCKASSVGLLLGMCPGRLLCDRRRPSVLFLGNDAYGRIHARGSRRGSEYGCPRRLVGIWLDFWRAAASIPDISVVGSLLGHLQWRALTVGQAELHC